MHTFNLFVVLLSLLVCRTVAGGPPPVSEWTTVGDGINHGSGFDSVRALKTWDHDSDGGTTALLAIGGQFTHTISSNDTSGFVLYNGYTNTYTRIGSGFFKNSGEDPGTVYAFCIDPCDGGLVIGGDFDTVNGSSGFYNVAKLTWTGSAWLVSTMSDPGGVVRSLAAYGGHVYAGLENPMIGGTYSALVKYCSGTWHEQQGSGESALTMSGGGVYALYPTFLPGDVDQEGDFVLAVGGTFLLGSGCACDASGYWFDGNFHSFDGGVLKTVYAYTTFTYDSNLAVGGAFEDSQHECPDGACDGEEADHHGKRIIFNLARRTSSDWTHFSSVHSQWGGVDGYVYALTMYNDRLVFGGSFSNAVIHSDPLHATNDHLLCYNRSHYLAEATGLYNVGYYVHTDGGSYYLPFGDGLSSTVYALETYLGVLYAGGEFSLSDQYYIAKWAVTTVVCGPADVGSQGGVPGPDGLLNNNDFVVFIDMFFNHDAGADLGQQGGIPGADSAWDNNDWVVFINYFFDGCPT
jgi:hypothetical protein